MENSTDKTSTSETTNNRNRSAIEWILIIAIGVFIANILTLTVYDFIVKSKSQQLLDTSNTAALEQQEIIKKESQIRQIKIRQQEALTIRLQKTCDYWQDQVEKKGSKESRRHRDTACAKVSQQ